jgi:hypothetical protein
MDTAIDILYNRSNSRLCIYIWVMFYYGAAPGDISWRTFCIFAGKLGQAGRKSEEREKGESIERRRWCEESPSIKLHHCRHVGGAFGSNKYPLGCTSADICILVSRYSYLWIQSICNTVCYMTVHKVYCEYISTIYGPIYFPKNNPFYLFLRPRNESLADSLGEVKGKPWGNRRVGKNLKNWKKGGWDAYSIHFVSSTARNCLLYLLCDISYFSV